MRCATLGMIVLGMALSVTALADGIHHDHHGMDHAEHHMAPAMTTGPWSYQGRDNPRPHRENRWEMIPVPGYGHMFINDTDLSRELRCAALIDNPHIMVDRKTRAACGEVPPPAVAPARAPADDEHRHQH